MVVTGASQAPSAAPHFPGLVNASLVLLYGNSEPHASMAIASEDGSLVVPLVTDGTSLIEGPLYYAGKGWAYRPFFACRAAILPLNSSQLLALNVILSKLHDEGQNLTLKVINYGDTLVSLFALVLRVNNFHSVAKEYVLQPKGPFPSAAFLHSDNGWIDTLAKCAQEYQQTEIFYAYYGNNHVWDTIGASSGFYYYGTNFAYFNASERGTPGAQVYFTYALPNVDGFTNVPSASPSSVRPSFAPLTALPSVSPSSSKPSKSPTRPTTWSPSKAPRTKAPSRSPSKSPASKQPTKSPTRPTTFLPSKSPATASPSKSPKSSSPSRSPSRAPTPPTTHRPTFLPSRAPTMSPSSSRPSSSPTPPTTWMPSSSPLTTGPSRSPTSTTPITSATFTLFYNFDDNLQSLPTDPTTIWVFLMPKNLLLFSIVLTPVLNGFGYACQQASKTLAQPQLNLLNSVYLTGAPLTFGLVETYGDIYKYAANIPRFFGLYFSVVNGRCGGAAFTNYTGLAPSSPNTNFGKFGWIKTPAECAAHQHDSQSDADFAYGSINDISPRNPLGSHGYYYPLSQFNVYYAPKTYTTNVTMHALATSSCAPTASPTHSTSAPTHRPLTPSKSPIISSPSQGPTSSPKSSKPTRSPLTINPTKSPSRRPTHSPLTSAPSLSPTKSPATQLPTLSPSSAPNSLAPSSSPIFSPTRSPLQSSPTLSPSKTPTTSAPSRSPVSARPSASPTSATPTRTPSRSPLLSSPTKSPFISSPSYSPSKAPRTARPSSSPTARPTTTSPSAAPSLAAPSYAPSLSPTVSPLNLAELSQSLDVSVTMSVNSVQQYNWTVRNPTTFGMTLTMRALPWFVTAAWLASNLSSNAIHQTFQVLPGASVVFTLELSTLAFPPLLLAAQGDIALDVAFDGGALAGQLKRINVGVNLATLSVIITASPPGLVFVNTLAELNRASSASGVVYVYNFECAFDVVFNVIPGCEALGYGSMPSWFVWTALQGVGSSELGFYSVPFGKGTPGVLSFAFNLNDSFVGNTSDHAAVVQQACFTINGTTIGTAVNTPFLRVINLTLTVQSPCPPGTFSSTGNNVGGCSPCGFGTFQDAAGATLCKPCDKARPLTLQQGASSNASCVAGQDRLVAADGSTIACPPGANCTALVGLTWATVPLSKGFWRTSAASTHILACPTPLYCQGGAITAQGQAQQLCYGNQTGPLCYSCPAGFAKSGPDRLCTLCDASKLAKDQSLAAGTVLGILAAFLFLVGLWALRVRTSAVTELDKKRLLQLSPYNWKRLANVNFYVVGPKFRIQLALLQVLGNMSLSFYKSLSNLFVDFGNFMRILSLDLIAIVDFGCVLPSQNLISSLLMATLLPAFAIVVVAVVFFLLRKTRYFAQSTERMRFLKESTAGLILFLLFVIYPSTSSTIMRMFTCNTLDDNSTSLIFDRSVDCGSSAYQSASIYAGFMVIVYTLGIPLLFLGVLMLRSGSVRGDGVAMASAAAEDNERRAVCQREGDPRIQYLRFLWSPYRPKYFYWESVELLRRLLQGAVLVFVAPGTTVQMVYELCVTFIFIAALSLLRPYINALDTDLAILSQWIIFFVTFTCLLLALDAAYVLDGGLPTYPVQVVEGFQVVLLILGPVVALAMVLFEAVLRRRNGGDGSSQTKGNLVKSTARGEWEFQSPPMEVAAKETKRPSWVDFENPVLTLEQRKIMLEDMLAVSAMEDANLRELNQRVEAAHAEKKQLEQDLLSLLSERKDKEMKIMDAKVLRHLRSG